MALNGSGLLRATTNIPDVDELYLNHVCLLRCSEAYFMALTTLSVAVSVLVLKVHHTSPSYELPGWLRRLVLVQMASVMRMNVTGVTRGRLRHLDCGSEPNDDKIWTISNSSSHRVCDDLAADNAHQANGKNQATYRLSSRPFIISLSSSFISQNADSYNGNTMHDILNEVFLSASGAACTCKTKTHIRVACMF